jgi:hypothetical protein
MWPPTPNTVVRIKTSTSSWERRGSISTGRSTMESRIRQAMSMPTPYGMTAPRVAKTPPMGSP